MSGTASPMWQTNGVVYSVLVSGNTIYVGGNFTQVRPPTGGAGAATARANLAAFNATTGALITGFNARVAGGNVRSLAMSANGQSLYIGGTFRTVGGQTRNRVAAVNPTTGAVQSFNPNSNSTVYAIAATSSNVYLGGVFTRMGNVARVSLAAVNPTTGALNTSFTPTMDQKPDQQCFPGFGNCPDSGILVTKPTVTALATNGTSLLAGGQFAGTNGDNAGGMASLDPSNGNTRPWGANSVQPINTNCGGRVSDIAISGSRAYVTGEGDPPGCYEGTYAADLTNNGALVWLSSCLGASQAIGVLNGVLYKGSHNHDCAFDKGGTAGFVGGTNRNLFIHRHLVAQDVTDGTFVHWSPDTNGAGNQPVGPRALDTGTLPNGQGVVVVGGDFTRVNGNAQQGVTRFVTGGDTATPDVPGRIINGDPWTGTPRVVAMRMPVTVQPTKANTLTVEFPASDDPDTGQLTYRIYRDGGNTPIATIPNVESFPWSRPVLRYDDTGLAAGSTHSYRVSASDGPHTSTRSAAVSGTVANAAFPDFTTAYSSLNPDVWWRLNDSGNTAEDNAPPAADDPNDRDGDLVGSATPGAPGAVSGDNGITVGDANGYVTSHDTIAEPNAFSESAWFKTTSTTGGVIVAQSDRSQGSGGNTDRMITMDNNGGLVFAIKSGGSSAFGVGTINIRNQGPVWNDGKWHNVVGTYDGNGNAALYVDGWLQGTAQGTPFDSTAKANGMPTSYLRAGYADLSGIQVVFGINFYNNHWPISDQFEGGLDEVTAYDKTLTAGQAASLFAAGVGGGA